MSSTSNPYHIQKPRVYNGLSTSEFEAALKTVVSSSGSSDALSKKLFSTQEITVQEYLRRHLPYTIYLLSIATAFAPSPEHICDVLTTAAKQGLDDRSLKGNYGTLFKSSSSRKEKDGEEGEERSASAAALTRSLGVLDRGTWFTDVQGLGSHVSFAGGAANIPYAPPSEGDETSVAEFFVNGEGQSVPFVRVAEGGGKSSHDVVKVSTEENPLWGQTYVRLHVDKNAYLIPGGKCFRRLEVFRLLARNGHFRVGGSSTSGAGDDGEVKSRAGASGRRHFPVPAYSYVDHANGYLLLHPPIHPLENGELGGGDGAVTLAQFIACRPRWWTVLGKEEKISSVFGWMTCLASTLSLFHSLKVSHGRINPKHIVLVHNEGDKKNERSGSTTVFITGWHLPLPTDWSKSHDAGMKQLRIGSSSINAQVNVASFPPSGSSGRSGDGKDGNTPEAEKSRQQDVKDLGEVFGDMLMLLLGTSRDALTRQRSQRMAWAAEVKSKEGFLKNLVEGEDDQNRGFYPPVPVTPASPPPGGVNVVDNTKGDADGAATPPAEGKTDVSEKRQSKTLLSREPSVKLFSSVFSSKRSSVVEGTSATSKGASAGAANALAEAQERAKIVQQQLNAVLPFSLGKTGQQFAVSWWVEELRLMYPPVAASSAPPPPPKKDEASPAEDKKEETKGEDKKEDSKAAESEQPTRNSNESTRSSPVKTAEFLGNKFIPLLVTMVSSEPSLRPRSREVWTTVSAICEDYYYIGDSNGSGASCCCRCSVARGPAGESEEEVIWDEIAETVLRDLYERGVADEEEEGWEGLGGATGGKFGWRRIGRVGEGVAGECLLD